MTTDEVALSKRIPPEKIKELGSLYLEAPNLLDACILLSRLKNECSSLWPDLLETLKNTTLSEEEDFLKKFPKTE